MKFTEYFTKRLFSSPGKKALAENFISLSFLQIANYILPLITLPYLVRVLGPGKFGLIAFAQALVQYFNVFTEYGFNLSATREISIHRYDKEKISSIFSSIIVIKLFLALVSFIILITIVGLVPRFRSEAMIYLFTFGIVIGNSLFATWFFQGVEKMKYITILNLIAKTIFTAAIFIFIKKDTQYVYVPLINSLGYIVAGFTGLIVIHRSFGIKFSIPGIDPVMHQLKEGWHIFISKMSISLSTTNNIFILGLFTNDIIVGYYAAGEKIIRVLISLFEPIFQSVYPYFSKLAVESKERAIGNLKKLFLYTSGISFFLFLVIFIFSHNLVILILGRSFIPSIAIVKILSPLIFIIPAAYIFANLGLLPFRLDKYFSRIYISAGVLNIFLLLWFIYTLNLGGVGAALTNLIIETVITLSVYAVLRLHNINIIFNRPFNLFKRTI
jgi:PST family polysaccharide transporter